MGEPWPILCDVQTSVMKLLGMNFPQPKMMHLVENIEEESPVIILQRWEDSSYALQRLESTCPKFVMILNDQ